MLLALHADPLQPCSCHSDGQPAAGFALARADRSCHPGMAFEYADSYSD